MGTLLSRYVDGELADKERKSIETHLETCASCRDVLNLFQRNDNVLNNALVGEAFGAQTVDAVMTEIRRLEEPMVVAPAVDDEPPPAPVAMRQVIQVTRMWPFAAAAALMIACVGGVLAFAKFGGFGGGGDATALERLFDRERQFAREEQESQRIALQAVLDRVRDLDQAQRDFEVRRQLESTKESTAVAHLGDQAIVIQANFSTEKFSTFEVYRTKEVGGGRFQPWSQLRDGLTAPYYKDASAEPGVNYMYQIRAIYRGDPKKYEDSVAVVQMLPLAGGLDPRRSLRIRFIGAHPDLSQATFEVSRYDNEKKISHFYTVKVGEKIGDVQTVDGKQVDFSTRHTLQTVVEREEELGVGPTPLTRRTRQVTLKADPKASDLHVKSFSLMLEREQYVPLPK
ncbi:MAG TPA: zf-HC2 domain-containing protein [Planctomycetota bacterium]|nr:zf-HC2 domain-containing protein [Planctomycetota bacterium]